MQALFFQISFALYCTAAFALLLWHGRRILLLAQSPAPVLPSQHELPPLSLIISARNEAQNLAQNLPALLAQAYPQHELLVVLDHCSDHSEDVLRKLLTEHPHLRFFHHRGAKALPGKKAALSAAIARATHPHLVFTDADCRPQSPRWLQHYGAAFAQKFNLVLGFGPLRSRGFWRYLVHFETLQTALHYRAAAAVRQPYMGVGRNLGYSQNLFRSARGYTGHSDLPSGDDDLFVNAVAQKARTAVLSDADSFMTSPGPAGLADWWRQKRRHYSTVWRYPPAKQRLLALEGALQLLFYLLLFPALLWAPALSVSLLLLRLLQFWYLQHFGARHFGAPPWWQWPLWEALWALFSFFIHCQNLFFGPRKNW